MCISCFPAGVLSLSVSYQVIVRKATVMLDGYDSISRLSRLYYAYIHKTSDLSGGGGLAEDRQMEAHFGRPQVLTRLGQFIMDVKVSSHAVDL
jgi:hypothetical protein